MSKKVEARPHDKTNDLIIKYVIKWSHPLCFGASELAFFTGLKDNKKKS